MEAILCALLKNNRLLSDSLSDDGLSDEHLVNESLSGGRLSGETLARELGISRAAVHKRIEKLRSAGWHIDAGKGYRLERPYPFDIIPEQIYNLTQTEIVFVPSCPSTNTAAKNLLKDKAFVLITRDQTAGRGRMKRAWQMTPDKDIAMSFVMPCDIAPSRLFSVIQSASVSVFKALSLYTDRLSIKWPNDIINDKDLKVCGILTESVLEENIVKYLVIGIGINVNSTPEIGDSLKNMLNKDLDINQICADIIINLNDSLKNLDKADEFWRKHLAWTGEEVRLIQNEKEYKGLFIGTDADGAVILNINGHDTKFLTGDLASLRKS